MKIQKQLSRKGKENKDYYKYVIILPEELLKESGFKEGDEIKGEAKKGEIRLRK
jgi:formylmethanofuran dehydrogenase subunit D